MPRSSRKMSKSKIQHVIVQGINKEYIFKNEKLIERYKEIICKKNQESRIKILAYCIMNNHAHFLIYSETIEDISKFMQKLNTSYSIYYNKINNRVGYVFRNRYYSQEILNQGQLYTCLRYIHNNPVKANMTKSMKEYQYSSYNEFFGERKIISEDSKIILFGAVSNFEKTFNYVHLRYKDDDEIFDIKEEKIDDYLKEVENIYKINIKEIKNNKKLLIQVIVEARKRTEVTIVELAKKLGVSKTTVGYYIRIYKGNK